MLRPSEFVRRCAGEILDPDTIVEPRVSVPRTRPRVIATCPWRRLHADENGKLTFATIFAVLALIVMIGFLGNTGHAVEEKIELQNAADAAAYSSALWMARGMNAVTATNHLLGELTALCVIHESLGGPELDIYGNEGWSVSQRHSSVESLNQQNRTFGDENLAPVTNKSPYWGSFLNPLHTPDAKLVKLVVDQVAEENEKFFSGATIYDAKVNLKRELVANLMAKTFANIGYFVPPWIGPVPAGIITAIAATAVHIYASTQVALIGKEWLVLKAIEKAAIVMAPVKKQIETQAIPTLASMSGYLATGQGGSDTSGGSLVSKQVTATLIGLGKEHDAELYAFPTKDKLQLPLVKEPAPKLSGSPPQFADEPPPEVNPNLVKQMLDMQKKTNEQESEATETRQDQLDDIEEVNEEIKQLVQRKEELNKDLEEINKLDDEDKKDTKPDDEDRKKKREERKTKREEINKELTQIETKLPPLKAKRAKLIDETKLKQPVLGGDNRPTGQKEEITNFPPLEQKQINANGQLKGRQHLQEEVSNLSQQESQIKDILNDKDSDLSAKERQGLETLLKRVQTMLADRRKELAVATNGPTDQIQQTIGKSGGNPTITNLKQVNVDGQNLRFSQWVRATYPYVDGFRSGVIAQFESPLGIPISKAAESFERYSNHFTLIKSLQMRTGMGWERGGAAPDLRWQKLSGREPQTMYVMKDMYVGDEPRKGHEPWVKDDAKAEKHFTVIGFAYRPAQDPLFAPSLFKNAHSKGRVAFAQAMVYNANEQKAAPDKPGSVQANVGWDTLNWEPPVQAFEHEGGKSQSGAMWPWELFSGDSGFSLAKAKVKLNWQAKLVPVTTTRMNEARNENKIPASVRSVLGLSKKNFGELVTH